MLITEKLVTQPDFPSEDLNDENTYWLGMALQNKGIVYRGHTFAERVYPMLSATHPALEIAATNLYEADRNLKAIDFGIRALEAMTLLVASDELKPDLAVLGANINGIVVVRNKNGVSDYFEQANYEFIQQTPRTAAVIEEGAGTAYDGRFAVLGGAIARQFALDNSVSEIGSDS